MDRAGQHVKLRTVATLFHQQSTRQPRDAMRGPDYLARLNEAARALSAVIDLYAVMGRETTQIPREALSGAVFADGGNILRTASGAIYRRLTVRRGQALAALTVLADEVPLRP